MRHALGGKRIRPVLCLATGDAVGATVESLLPAAAAVELVHSFSLVHDDLPALDDDRERRGAPSVWAQYGEATAILAGDALLAEAIRLALAYPDAAVARELVDATLAMIGGQQLDLEGGAQLEQLHALKTGALFSASVMCGALGGRGAGRRASRRGARSRPSSACSSRSSTTCSTATATSLEVGEERRAPPRGRGRGARAGAARRDRRGHGRARARSSGDAGASARREETGSARSPSATSGSSSPRRRSRRSATASPRSRSSSPCCTSLTTRRRRSASCSPAVRRLRPRSRSQPASSPTGCRGTRARRRRGGAGRRAGDRRRPASSPAMRPCALLAGAGRGLRPRRRVRHPGAERADPRGRQHGAAPAGERPARPQPLDPRLRRARARRDPRRGRQRRARRSSSTPRAFVAAALLLGARQGRAARRRRRAGAVLPRAARGLVRVPAAALDLQHDRLLRDRQLRRSVVERARAARHEGALRRRIDVRARPLGVRHRARARRSHHAPLAAEATVARLVPLRGAVRARQSG